MIFKRGQFLGALPSFFFFFPAATFAAVTVTPQTPWVADGSSTVYYSTDSSSPTLDTDSGYRTIDVTRTKSNETGSRSNMIRVTVRSDKDFTLTAGQQLLVTAWAEMTTGTTRAVPLAYAGSGDCVDNSNCQASSYAARYANRDNLVVGFYPLDICAGIFAADATAQVKGCDTAGSFDAPGTNEATSMKLTFYVTATTSLNGVPAQADLGSESAALTFKIQNGKPTFTCDDMNNVYFPADSSILVYTNKFTGTAANGALAPISKILAIAKRNGTPDLSSTAFSVNNDIVGRLPYRNGTQIFSGFINASTVSDTANTYTVQFNGVDFSGALATFSNSCRLTDVQAMEVKGFLKKSNCFIATAAHRSTDAGSVMLLRRFRDHVLLPTSLGRAFVQAYYRWSPDAAEWLVKNPQFRLPVLWALLPVQGLAWVFLDPLLRLSLLVGVALILSAILRWVRLREGSSL